jgi:hypothetical protein
MSSCDNRGSYNASRDILQRDKGDHLDRVQSDQMGLEMIRQGRLVR